MKIDRERFRHSGREYDERWKAADEVLYALCRQFPKHKDLAGINAKVMIIGRAYATGIERAAGKAKVAGSARGGEA